MQTKHIVMILKLLLNTQMIWMMLTKILKNTIQTRKAKYYLYLMIWLLMCVIIKNLINSNLPIVTELFIRGRKLNVSLVFIPQFYFDIPKYIRLNSTHYFIMKISNKQELQQIAFEDFTILLLHQIILCVVDTIF